MYLTEKFEHIVRTLKICVEPRECICLMQFFERLLLKNEDLCWHSGVLRQPVSQIEQIGGMDPCYQFESNQDKCLFSHEWNYRQGKAGIVFSLLHLNPSYLLLSGCQVRSNRIGLGFVQNLRSRCESKIRWWGRRGPLIWIWALPTILEVWLQFEAFLCLSLI